LEFSLLKKIKKERFNESARILRGGNVGTGFKEPRSLSTYRVPVPHVHDRIGMPEGGEGTGNKRAVVQKGEGEGWGRMGDDNCSGGH